MTDTILSEPSDTTGAAWREYSGRRVIVRALNGSYAARCAPAMLREAERAAEALEKLLSPSNERHGARVALYLTDPLASAAPQSSVPNHHGASNTVNEEIGVLVVQPEAERESTIPILTQLLLMRWFSPDIADEALLRDGIAGFVAARIGSGPSEQAAHDQVRADLAAGRLVSTRPRSVSQPDGGASAERVWATSFIAFLVETFSSEALSQFLSAYDPDRRDQAAQIAFQRPLGALEESWLNGLRRPARSESAFRTLFRYLIPLLKPYWPRLIEILFYMLIGLSYSLAVPLASKYLVDTILPSRDVATLTLLLLALLILFVLNSVFGVRRGYVNAWINQRILIDLRERMFAHLQRLAHGFYARAKVGDIMARLTSDMQQFQQAMSQVAGVGIFLALRALTAAVTLMILSPLLGLLVLITVPIFAVSYFLLQARFERAAYDQQRLMGETIALTQENLLAHAVIKALGLEQQAIEAYSSRLSAQFNAYLRLIVVALLYETSTTLAVTIGQLVVLGVGGYMVISGSITIGTLLAFLGVLPSLFDPISALSDVGQTVQSASGAITRVNELLQEPVSIADRPEAIIASPLAHEIRFDDVTFSYDSERQILQNLSLTISAGKHIAIVGPSGSGKSTIVNLLMRFWDPDDGRILLDNHDLRDVTLASLRNQIGIVFQDTFVFDTTLRENIRIGRRGATDIEIAAAAQAARLDSYIASLPNGYDTVLGERGVRMSGGQRQRLAIARALLRDPRILVLDEATSALDAQTEREILDTLDVAARGRTTISITHRLALAAAADQILVLDQGRLVEQGSHTELIQAGGLYRRLYDEQMSYVAGGGPLRAEVEVARLRAIPLFAGLDSEALATLATRLELERRAAGEDIIQQGDVGERLYLIDRGQVEVLVASDHGERRINLLNEGDYFGELALLSEQTRNANVRTTMPTLLYSLSRADFTELLQQEASIREAVSSIVVARAAAFTAAGAVKAA